MILQHTLNDDQLTIVLHYTAHTGIYDDLPYTGTFGITALHIQKEVENEVVQQSQIGWLTSERATELLEGKQAEVFAEGE